MRMLPDRNSSCEFERIWSELPDFMIRLVANVQAAALRLKSHAGKEHGFTIFPRVHRFLQFGVPVCITKNIDRATVPATHVEFFAVGAEDQTVEHLWEGNELPLASLVKAHQINPCLIVSRAYGNY